MATIRRDHTGKNKKGITPPLSAGNTPLRLTPTNLYPSKTNNYLIAQYHQYSLFSPKRPNYLRSTVSSATTTDVSKQPGERKPPAIDNVAPSKSTSTRRKPSDKTPSMPVVLKPWVSANASVSCPSPSNGRTNAVSCPSPSNGRTNVGPRKLVPQTLGAQKPLPHSPVVQKPVPPRPVVQKPVPPKPVVQKPAPKKAISQKNVPNKILRTPIKDPLKQRSSSSTKPLSTARKSVASGIKKKKETRNGTSSVRKEKIAVMTSHGDAEKTKKVSTVPEEVKEPRAQEPSVVECDDHVRQPQHQESSIVEGSNHDNQTEQVVTEDGKGTDDHETEQVVTGNGKGAHDHETEQVVSESEKATDDHQTEQVVSISEKGTDDHQKEKVVSNNEKGTDDVVVKDEGSKSIVEKEMETDDTDTIVIQEASRVLEEPSPIICVKIEERPNFATPEAPRALEEPSPIICVKTEERPTFVTSEAPRGLEEPSPIIAVKTEDRPKFEEAIKAQEIEELYLNEVNRSIACEVELRITCASVEKDNPPIEEAKKQEATELNKNVIEAQEIKEIKGQLLVEEKKHKAGTIAVAAQEKKNTTISNSVIEETANKLHELRKNRVRALAGAFETVISKQEK